MLQVLPLELSIAHYRTFVHHHISSAITIFVDITDLSSGLFNVLLVSIARPILFPYVPPSPDTTTETTCNIGFRPLGPPRRESVLATGDYSILPEPDLASERNVRGLIMGRAIGCEWMN
jgi:hypothetical protein